MPMVYSNQKKVSYWQVAGIILALLAITLLHYLTNARLLNYHSVYRSLYYVPIMIAGVIWGRRGGVATSLVATALYLPYVLFFAERGPGRIVDMLLEILLFNIVAIVTGALADAQRHRQEQADMLATYIHDVLISLPVGVATVRGDDGDRTPRNPMAAELLRGLADPRQLPVNLGYFETLVSGRPVGVHCSPLHATNGAAIGHVFVLEDLSEQQRLAEQARRAERLAALGQLAGGLAHEIRNPLGIVRATAQLLATKLGDRSDLAVHTTVLTTETDRIERLIAELLAYANPRALQIAEFRADDLIDELLIACMPYANQYGVWLQSEIDSMLPPMCADREQVRQALLNLLFNAVQASRPGDQVRVVCRTEHGQMCFRITDQGAGIPPPIRSRVFDPFVTAREDGTGMGLAMVARIASDHKGSIDLRDATGGGTEATFCIPLETR